jgi:hypothetical protein
MAKRLIIVVKAAAAAAANARAKEIDIAGGERTFVVGLSATGARPATHYWCSWNLSDGDHDSLRTKLQTAVDSNNARIFNGDLMMPEDVLATVELSRLEDAP